MSSTGTFGIQGIPPPKGLVSKTENIPYVPGIPKRHEISEVADPDTQEGKDQVYMALYEQLIWENMIEIIDSWELSESETARWKKAADGWRLPYWDWARKQEYTQNFALPEVLTLTTVAIFPPQGLKVPINNPQAYPNPLYGFGNPEKNADGTPRPLGQMPADKALWNIKDNGPRGVSNTPANPDVLPWSLTTGTGRWGIKIDNQEYTGLTGVNNFEAANEFIANMDQPNHWYLYNPGNLSDSVNRMLSPKYNSTWGTFASTKWPGDAEAPSDSPAWLSLEYIHNNVHNITSSFDFDLPVMEPEYRIESSHRNIRHIQIDRLLAIWQALYWNLWWDSKEPPTPKPHRPDATPEDPLQPFHTKSNGDPDEDVWTSAGVRDWTKLGYQYDDLEPKASALNSDGTLNESQYKTELEAYIHKTYPGSAQVVGTIRSMKGIRIPKGISAEEGETFKDYIINVKYDRYALGGVSYSIKFYLGGPNGVPETKYSDGNYVGEIFTFTAPYEESDSAEASCSNCKAQAEAGVLSQGQIPLTIPLLNHIFDQQEDHPIKEYKEVAEYLRLHLNWKFVQQGGLVRDPKDFPKTKVYVLQGTAQPRYTDPEEITGAELKAVAALAVNAYAAQPSNDLKPVSAENVPAGAVALTPVFHDYSPVYEATQDKRYGLAPPSA
ncbi:tyrosinase precursor [Fusarium beomiforme]|uniref:Tyrosinase n=1 Tax=Fusarium beomiforme TaxID=44412 RepID=A0A9P5E0U0_9HYPO|nr:tyrosinase precursor [Fusarium beomiforme]